MDDVQIEVIVIDDHPVLRKGLERLLAKWSMRVAGVGASVKEARGLLARRRHDVALIDIHLGKESALGLVREHLCMEPDAAVVLYTGYIDDGLQEAARVGALGFVLKTSPPARLAHALRCAAAGDTYIDPKLTPLLARRGDACRVDQLSPREREILELLSMGMNGREIARRLFLSPETVRTHVRNATMKLGAKTRVQAVALVVHERRHDTLALPLASSALPLANWPPRTDCLSQP